MTAVDGEFVDLLAPSASSGAGFAPVDGELFDLFAIGAEPAGPLWVEGIRARSRDASVLFGSGGPAAPGIPPTIANILPASGSPIQSYDAIEFDVVDPLGPFSVTASMAFSGAPTETVFAGGAFVAPYNIASSIVAITNGYRYTFRRGGGFRAGATLNISASGTGGGVATASASYAVSSPAPNPSPDAVAPVVSGVSPAPGTTITASTPLQFDVTDNTGAFRRIFVSVRFERTGVEEVAFDGDTFRGFYAAVSSRTMIAGGFHFSVRRSDGWQDSPVLKVVAIDPSGNEVAVL